MFGFICDSMSILVWGDNFVAISTGGNTASEYYTLKLVSIPHKIHDEGIIGG